MAVLDSSCRVAAQLMCMGCPAACLKRGHEYGTMKSRQSCNCAFPADVFCHSCWVCRGGSLQRQQGGTSQCYNQQHARSGPQPLLPAHGSVSTFSALRKHKARRIKQLDTFASCIRQTASTQGLTIDSHSIEHRWLCSAGLHT